MDRAKVIKHVKQTLRIALLLSEDAALNECTKSLIGVCVSTDEQLNFGWLGSALTDLIRIVDMEGRPNKAVLRVLTELRECVYAYDPDCND